MLPYRLRLKSPCSAPAELATVVLLRPQHVCDVGCGLGHSGVRFGALVVMCLRAGCVLVLRTVALWFVLGRVVIHDVGGICAAHKTRELMMT